MLITDNPLELSENRELLARACAGEGQAFCLLMEPLQARLLRQAVALTNDLNSAEDLVSETLVEAWKSLPRYNRTCRLSTWLYAILLHRHRKAIRRTRCRPPSLAGLSFFEARDLHQQQENLPSPDLSPSETMAQNETSVRLRQSLESLPDKSIARSFCCAFLKMLPCRTWRWFSVVQSAL